MRIGEARERCLLCSRGRLFCVTQKGAAQKIEARAAALGELLRDEARKGIQNVSIVL